MPPEMTYGTCLPVSSVPDTREILLAWARWGGEDLAAAGYSQERYMEELERNLARHEEIGRGMAERFAEIAATRARSAA